jgi:hypothetical protein
LAFALRFPINRISNYLKTADPPEAEEFAEKLLVIYTYLSGLCVLCGEF